MAETTVTEAGAVSSMQVEIPEFLKLRVLVVSQEIDTHGRGHVDGRARRCPADRRFLGKFFIFSLAVEAKLWWGVALAFVGAAAGFYYYFKISSAPSGGKP